MYIPMKTGGSLYDNRRRTTCSLSLRSDYTCLQTQVHNFVLINISTTTQMRSLNTSFNTVPEMSELSETDKLFIYAIVVMTMMAFFFCVILS